MGTRKRFPVKLLGKISWIGGPDDDVIVDVPIQRAWFRSKSEIVIDCRCDINRYAVSLKSLDAIRFDGDFVGLMVFKKWPVRATATLYSNLDGYFLYGRWYEDGDKYSWWVELRPVARFPDEVG